MKNDSMQKTKLKRVAEINPRKSEIKDRLNFNDKVSFIPMSVVDDEHGELMNVEEKRLEDVYKGYTYIRDGDVIFAKITPCMENGKCAIAKGLVNGCAFGSTEFYVISPKKDILAKWIWLFLRQQKIRKKAKKHFTGAVGQQRVPKWFIEDLEIPVPFKNGKLDLKEQEKIVDKIDKLFEEIDKGIEKTQQALKDSKKLLKSELRKFFNKKLTNKKEFQLIEITKKIKAGGTPRTSNKKYWKGNIAFARISDITDYEKFLNKTKDSITENGLENSSSWLVPKKSLILSMYGTVGEVVINNIPVAVTQNMAGIIPNDDISTKYLYYALRFVKENTLDKILKISVHKHFGITEARKIKVFVPVKNGKPDLEEQKRIAGRLDKIQERSQKLQEKLEEQLRDFKLLKQSILNQAFQGKL